MINSSVYGILITSSCDIHINDTHAMQAGINTLDMFRVTNCIVANIALVNATGIGANVVDSKSVGQSRLQIGIASPFIHNIHTL